MLCCFCFGRLTKIVSFTLGTISINFRWMWRSLECHQQHVLLVKSGVLFVERLRKRPRRFSRRFIQSELAKLCQYRDIVRAIQHSGVSMPDFGFQVPAYIKVGATVTAIHWQRRVLHRGIVLGHDPFRSGYLVQFERQELGFQFCPDYEVATHGMPETLLHASDATLEGTRLGGFANRNMGPG